MVVELGEYVPGETNCNPVHFYPLKNFLTSYMPGIMWRAEIKKVSQQNIGFWKLILDFKTCHRLATIYKRPL